VGRVGGVLGSGQGHIGLRCPRAMIIDVLVSVWYDNLFTK